MPTGAVVDTLTAENFLAETLARVPAEELHSVAADLRRRTDSANRLLGDDPARMTREQLRSLLRWGFSTRRHANEIIDAVGAPELAAALADLVGSTDAPGSRILRFDEVVGIDGPGRFDLAPEVLHFSAPQQYWLWTRWIWDPDADTGALRLVTLDEVDLVGADRADTYTLVGQAQAFVEETGKARGFTALGEGLYGTNVFLASVYAVYLHTVLGMRMTREFTRLAPEVGELVRRLLGVHHKEN